MNIFCIAPREEGTTWRGVTGIRLNRIDRIALIYHFVVSLILNQKWVEVQWWGGPEASNGRWLRVDRFFYEYTEDYWHAVEKYIEDEGARARLEKRRPSSRLKPRFYRLEKGE